MLLLFVRLKKNVALPLATPTRWPFSYSFSWCIQAWNALQCLCLCLSLQCRGVWLASVWGLSLGLGEDGEDDYQVQLGMCSGLGRQQLSSLWCAMDGIITVSSQQQRLKRLRSCQKKQKQKKNLTLIKRLRRVSEQSTCNDKLNSDKKLSMGLCKFLTMW